jgi:hypothetical protein
MNVVKSSRIKKVPLSILGLFIYDLSHFSEAVQSYLLKGEFDA